MEPVALDPNGYGGSYKLIGGEVSLDFVNTVSWAGTEREHDWLDRIENVTMWAYAAGVISRDVRRALEASSRPSERNALAEVHRIRSDLSVVLTPLAHGRRPRRDAVERLNELVQGSCGRRRIDVRRHAWAWEAPSTLVEMLAPVVWNAAHVLTGVDRTRLGHCPACGWIYYDSTRNRSRRWCDMSDCGSRDKALRYYHRSKPVSDQ